MSSKHSYKTIRCHCTTARFHNIKTSPDVWITRLEHYTVHLSVSLCVCLFGQYTVYLAEPADPPLIPVSFSSVAWPKQAHRCLEEICLRLTSCHYMLLFLTPILLSAYSPSIIHGWEQTFVFCLNNWLKAWSEQRESASAWVKNRNE